MPGIKGLNFVLKNSLGGGGIASLRSDPQVKCSKPKFLYGSMVDTNDQ